ncbi:unnamed protein product, partial [Closterium sp. NIES-54]
YLGLNIQEDEDAIYLNAAKYADTIAKRFALTPTTISTPYRYTAGINKEGSAPLKSASIRDYQRKLGCLLFAAVTCRPDLSYSASQLDEIEKGRLELSYCPTSEMAADYLTKKLGKQKVSFDITTSQLNPIDGLYGTLRNVQRTLAVLTKSLLIPLSTNLDPRIGAGAAGAGSAGGAGGATGATGGAGAAGGGARAGAAGGAAGTGDPGAEGTSYVSAVSGGAARPRPYYVPLLQEVLGSPTSPGPPPPFLSPPPVQSQSQLPLASPLPGPSPYSGPTRGLTERREPESRPVSPVSRSASPVRTVRAGRVSRPRPPPVPGTHSMTLRPSTAPQRVPLPSPPPSSLPDGPDPESDSLRAASPTVTRFLATAVTDPLFESSVASALVAQLVDFAAACRLDYATSLVAESASVSVCPPSVGGECALGTDVLEDRQENLECFAAAVPHLVSMLLAPEGDPDALDIPTPRSYAEAIEVPYSSQWVKRPPGSPPTFKARYVARGFSQREGVDFFQTFSPTPKMTTLRVLLHVAAQRDYELHSLDFSTAFLQSSLHEEIWLRRPPGFTGSFPASTQWSLWSQSTVSARHPVLQRFDFTYSSPQSTPLPSSHSLLAPPSDESVEQSGPYPELVGCLITSGMGLVLGGRARVVLTGHADASWVDDLATQRSSQGYTFSLGSGSVSWWSTRSSVLSSSCEAEIYDGAMAAQELRWLTYLLTDLGEAPRSPPVLYVDNKAMLALCQEHRLENRTKHIALRCWCNHTVCIRLVVRVRACVCAWNGMRA